MLCLFVNKCQEITCKKFPLEKFISFDIPLKKSATCYKQIFFFTTLPTSYKIGFGFCYIRENKKEIKANL